MGEILSDTDAKVQELFNVLQKQKKQVEQDEQETKQSWKTKCSIVVTSLNANPINIQVATQQMIVAIGIALLQYQRDTTEVAKLLGVDLNTQTYDGYPLEDWFADLKKRIAVLNIAQKRRNLVVLEARLDAIVSPEHKRQLELAALTAALGV